MGKFISKIFPSLTFGNWRWHAVFDEDDRTKHTKGIAEDCETVPLGEIIVLMMTLLRCYTVTQFH